MARLPSLNALRAFETVARLGSVSLAGDELSVTPGAVSRHIKELENDLGVTILERDGRGVCLTADGKRLRNNLRPAFEMINSAVLRMRRDPRRKRLLIMVSPLFATNWLIPRLELFSRRAPKVDIVVADRFGVEDPAAAGVDIVIEWGIFDNTAEFQAERLTRERVIPVCSRSACPDGNLADATFLHRHGLPKTFDFPDWSAFLAAVGLEELDGIGSHAGSSFSRGLIIDAAREGMGVALVYATVARDDLAAGRLVRPIPESMETDIGYWLLTSRAARDRSEVKAFRAWLLEELAGSESLSAEWAGKVTSTTAAAAPAESTGFARTAKGQARTARRPGRSAAV